MKKIQPHFIIVFSMIMLTGGCTYDFSKTSCEEQALLRYNMVGYRGEEIPECTSYLLQYKWKGESYFDWENTCTDKLSMPTDCDGNLLTEEYSDPEFSTFHFEAEIIGIIGIRH